MRRTTLSVFLLVKGTKDARRLTKMNNDKKNTIIKEIQYWKNSKLLPETYCDFLLALYTEGNQDEEDIIPNKNDIRKGITFFEGVLCSFLLFLLAATLLVIYFTELFFVLQMIIVVLFLVTSFVVTAYFIRKRAFYQVPLSLTFIQLLLVSIFMVEYFASGDRIWMGGIIVTNCFLWILAAGLHRIMYLLISGVVGLIIFVLTIIF
jgi:hypothetical protein